MVTGQDVASGYPALKQTLLVVGLIVQSESAPGNMSDLLDTEGLSTRLMQSLQGQAVPSSNVDGCGCKEQKVPHPLYRTQVR